MIRQVLGIVSVVLASAAHAVDIEGGDPVRIDDNNVADYADGIRFTSSDGVVEFYTTQAPGMNIEGAGTVKKMSSGTWTMTKSITDFTGDYRIVNGIAVLGTTVGVLGKNVAAGGGVYVEDGATLRFTGTAKGLIGARPLHISGSGVDGAGALDVAATLNSSPVDFSRLILDADAVIRISASKYVYYRNTNAPIEFNGHRLFVKGGGIFYNSAETGLGEVVVLGDSASSVSVFSLRNSTSVVEASDSNPFVLGEYGALWMYCNVPRVERPLYVGGTTAQMYASEQFEGNYAFDWNTNVVAWAGPVRFTNESGIAELALSSGYTNRQFSLLGPITGPGKVSVKTMKSAHVSRLYLGSAGNTFSGGFYYQGKQGGDVLAAYPTSLGGDGTTYENVTADYGRIVCEVDDGGSHWDLAHFTKLIDEATWQNSAYAALQPLNCSNVPLFVNDGSLALSGTWRLLGDVAFSYANSSALKGLIWSGDRGPLHVRSAQPIDLTGLQLKGGSVMVGAEKICGSLAIEGNSVVQTGADILRIGGYDANTAKESARLVLENAKIVTSCERKASYTSINDCALGVGVSENTTKDNTGILDIRDGAIVSNKLVVGGGREGSSQFTGVGAVYQQDGAVTALGGSSASNFDQGIGIAARGSGSYEMQDGSFVAVGNFSIGGYGQGCWTQYGGEAATEPYDENASGDFRLASQNAGWGAFVVRGGSFRSAYSVVCNAGGNGDNFSHIVIDGDGAVFETDGKIGYHYHQSFASSIPSYLEVNRYGVLKVGKIAQRQEAGLYVGFDGGTLKAAHAGVNLFGQKDNWNELPQAINSPTRITVYSGGITVDTDGKDVRIDENLQGATGNGIKSVTLSEPLVGASYIGSPIVRIDGDGEGASAVAEFDTSLGAVTNIHVTAPGVGYNVASAIVYVAKSPVAVLPCVVAKNAASGAFTKKGAGMLTLSGANTYAGDTVLAGGTLKVASANAIPAGSKVILKGGTIDAGEYPESVPKNWELDFNDVRQTGAYSVQGDLVFPEGGVLSILGLASIPSDAPDRMTLLETSGTISGSPVLVTDGLPEGWKCVIRQKKIEVLREKGLMLIFR